MPKRNKPDHDEEELVDSEPDETQYVLKEGQKVAKMPQKSNFRMHAHINPMNEMMFPYPQNPDYVDWSLHYPQFFGIEQNNGDKMYANTPAYPNDYEKKVHNIAPAGEEESKGDAQVLVNELCPTILDIGCGYGGLLFQLSKEFPDKLALGMEIRDKVTNFVVNKINATRINSSFTHCMNAAALRTNSMKTLTNYFRKESVEKMFFCFADPHFKKVNHRRRIINTDLLSDYSFVLKEGGLIYIVTDVKDLFDWEYSHLKQHPLFVELPKEVTEKDPCVAFMSQDTDEARKVIRNGGEIWHAVFKKKTQDRSDEEKKQALESAFL